MSLWRTCTHGMKRRNGSSPLLHNNGIASCIWEISAFELLLCLLLAGQVATFFKPTLASNKPQLLDYRKLHYQHWLKLAAKHLSTSQAANTLACSTEYGEQYLQRWHKLQGVYCDTSTTAETPGSTSSSVTCHAHPDADISICAAYNLVLQSSGTFLGKKDGIPGLPNPAAGSIQLACNQTADPKNFLRSRLQSNEGSRMWLVQAPKFGVPVAEQQRFCSPGRIVTHPVLFIMRVDPENAFHHLEAVVSVFAALAAVQLPPQQYWGGLEVVMVDDHLPGYFTSIWQRLSYPHPLRVLREQPFPDNTCFSTAIIAPYTAHTQSILTYRAGAADEVYCESPVLHACSLWLRHLFRDLLPARSHAGSASSTDGSTDYDYGSKPSNSGGSSDSSLDGRGSGSSTSHSSTNWRNYWYHFGPRAAADLADLQPSPVQSQLQMEHLHVLWLSRSRFERQHQERLTAWQRARQIPAQQQEQLLLELQRVVLKWNEQTCVHGQTTECKRRTVAFSLQVAELSELPFYPDQISLLMRTGVLIGVHGAGLANQVFLTPKLGAIVEVWHNMENNFHYHNLAHMLGHKYYNVHCEEELEVQQVVAKVQAAMDAVAAAYAAAAATRGKASWWRKAWPG